MKKANLILAVSLLMFALFLSGCSSSKPLILTPNKIIIYAGGKSKQITPTHKDFDKILNLINSRIVPKDLAVAKDGGDMDTTVNEYKKSALSMEFLYDKEQSFSVRNKNGGISFDYYRLFFDLTGRTQYFQYGNQTNYKDSSRGPLKESMELVAIGQAIMDN